MSPEKAKQNMLKWMRDGGRLNRATITAFLEARGHEVGIWESGTKVQGVYGLKEQKLWRLQIDGTEYFAPKLDQAFRRAASASDWFGLKTA